MSPADKSFYYVKQEYEIIHDGPIVSTEHICSPLTQIEMMGHHLESWRQERLLRESVSQIETQEHRERMRQTSKR